MRRSALFAFALLLPGPAALAAPAQLPATVQALRCESCHGSDGNSSDPSVPRLNGQIAGYIERRLKEFLDLPSQDPHAFDMGQRASKIHSDSFAAIGAYYASAAPSPARPDPRRARAGEALYLRGAPGQRIAACVSCHGPNGEGSGTAPRLAGQHGLYLRHQLERMRLYLRVSEPMFHNSQNMTDDQIRDLVAYLGGD